MERRKFPRSRVQFKVALSFSQGQTSGEGKLMNLAQGGARIRSNKRVAQGDFLTLQIYPSKSGPPIAVETAAVRWVQGVEFGVDFLKLQPDHLARLRDLLTSLGEDPGKG